MIKQIKDGIEIIGYNLKRIGKFEKLIIRIFINRKIFIEKKNFSGWCISFLLS